MSFKFGKQKNTEVITSPHEDYDKEWCYQYDIRLRNRKKDLSVVNMTEDEAKELTIDDFEFYLSTSKDEHDEMTQFIKRHEWMGTISQFTTHWFACRCKKNGALAGVILMNQPNAFSKLMGEDTPQLERLISRGACISWSPKCLASKFLMWCIRWMVDNTQYRLFTAYSDTEAKELGTIYQACNFYYLGRGYGTNRRYVNPYNGKMVSSRVFRARSFYKRYAKDLGITWQKDWNDDQHVLWNNIPDEVERQLRAYSKKMESEAKYIDVPSKHKYAYVLGRDKRETRDLRRLLLANTKVYDYPKVRGE